MEDNQIIETIGSITKMEHLRSIKEGVLDNTLVLKSANPFPGIRSDGKMRSEKPDSYFVVLRYRYAPEKINRINSKLRREKNLFRIPSYGEIVIQENILPCVRLKELRNSDDIVAIQEFLRDSDLQLKPFNEIDKFCRIKIFKSFHLEEIGDGLYRDLYDKEKIYIRIKSSINWKRFDYVIKKIKYSLQNSEFDAAMGVIFRFVGPENVIRIYDRDKSYERAIFLRKLFLKEIKDEIHLSAAAAK